MLSLRFSLLLILMISLSGNVYSQKEYSGYLITLENDTLRGKVKVKKSGVLKNKWSWPVSVGFAKRKGKKFKSFDPEEIKGFGYRGKDRKLQWFHSKKVLGRQDQKYVFSPKPEIAGSINLYKTKGHQPKSGPGVNIGSFGPSISVGNKQFLYYIEKGERFVYIDYDNYKTMLNAFLSDCPDLQAKIGEKGYYFKDLESVIVVANDCLK